MGLIINIDEALKLRTDFNILNEPLNAMLKDTQEAWEKKNPIDLLFHRSSIDTFQDTYTSSIGFEHAFAETSDYGVGPIFNTAEGFSSTYRTRTFQGGFIITQTTLEDRRLGQAKDDASAFIKRWQADVVEYAIKSISGGFGSAVSWGSAANGGVSKLKLTSADTADGALDSAKNPLFYKSHTIVLRDGMTSTVFNAAKQSNMFKSAIDLAGSDPAKIAKLADIINQVITIMENYKDDNNKRAGVLGSKVIVAGNNANLKAALDTALSLNMFNEMGQNLGLNPAYKRATVETSPYLLDIPQCADGVGFFIVDKAYNAANHGPELTERVPFTLNVDWTKKPYGVSYDGRQRFDMNSSSWRGIAYVYIGTPSGTSTEWNYTDKFTALTPNASLITPVSVASGAVNATIVNTAATPVYTDEVPEPETTTDP